MRHMLIFIIALFLFPVTALAEPWPTLPDGRIVVEIFGQRMAFQTTDDVVFYHYPELKTGAQYPLTRDDVKKGKSVPKEAIHFSLEQAIKDPDRYQSILEKLNHKLKIILYSPPPPRWKAYEGYPKEVYGGTKSSEFFYCSHGFGYAFGKGCPFINISIYPTVEQKTMIIERIRKNAGYYGLEEFLKNEKYTKFLAPIAGVQRYIFTSKKNRIVKNLFGEKDWVNELPAGKKKQFMRHHNGALSLSGSGIKIILDTNKSGNLPSKILLACGYQYGGLFDFLGCRYSGVAKKINIIWGGNTEGGFNFKLLFPRRSQAKKKNRYKDIKTYSEAMGIEKTNLTKSIMLVEKILGNVFIDHPIEDLR